MAILPFVNLKGGVAKTTNAVAVAECLATLGYRVLLVDADHQCMAGELLLGELRYLRCERDRNTLHDLLAATLTDGFSQQIVRSCVIPGGSNIGGGLDKLHVLPCSIRIDEFSTNMAKARRGYHSLDEFYSRLRNSRKQFRTWLNQNFDFTIVDCPPSTALQVRYFLTMADAFVLPTVPDRLSVRGAFLFLNRIKKNRINISGLGTLWSLYRVQNTMHRRVVDGAGDGHRVLLKLPRPFETVIPNAARIGEAADWGTRPSSFNAKYSSELAKRFRLLCKEIVHRSQWPEMRRPGASVQQRQ